VILDLTIVGGMEGEETLNKLLVLNPEIRAIVSSAHADKPIVANYRDYGFSGRITKPINFDGLLEEIERVMSIRI
jgi:DNA-binding NarL/FixJ family response regulator